MNKMNRTELSVFISGLMIMLFLLGGCGGSDSPKEAPDFTLKDLSDNQVSLQDHRGKVVLVDFWATWCPACQYSIPDLIRMQNEYEDKGLVILAISLDDPDKANNSFLKAFKDKKSNELYGASRQSTRYDGLLW